MGRDGGREEGEEGEKEGQRQRLARALSFSGKGCHTFLQPFPQPGFIPGLLWCWLVFGQFKVSWDHLGEKTLKMGKCLHQFDLKSLWGIFLVNDLCERIQLTVESSIPGQSGSPVLYKKG